MTKEGLTANRKLMQDKMEAEPHPMFCEAVNFKGNNPAYPELVRIAELEKQLAGIDGTLDQMAKKIASLEKHCLQLSQQIFEIQSNK